MHIMSYFWSIILSISGADRPHQRYLNRYVRTDITGKWHDIGLELLDIKDEQVLKTIKIDNPGDAEKCTDEMLQSWLDRSTDATWDKLIKALRAPHIKLENVASKVEGMLMKGTYNNMHACYAFILTICTYVRI